MKEKFPKTYQEEAKKTAKQKIRKKSGRRAKRSEGENFKLFTYTSMFVFRIPNRKF